MSAPPNMTALLAIVEGAAIRAGSARGFLDKAKLAQAAVDLMHLDAFRTWFSGSHVARNGRPLLTYHGTAADFASFDPAFLMSGMNDGEADEGGFYFTTRGAMAARYAQRTGRVIPAFLRVLNPYRATAMQWARAEGLSPAEAQAQGHDGFLVEGQEGGQTWIVFSPDAIWEVVPTTIRRSPT